MTELSEKEELAQDLKWDFDSLSEKLQLIPHLVVKWGERYHRAKYDKEALERQYKSRRRLWYDFYCGRSNPKFNDGRVHPVQYDKIEVRNEIINDNDELRQLQKTISQIEMKMNDYKLASESCRNLYYHIQSYIKWQQFINGVDD